MRLMGGLLAGFVLVGGVAVQEASAREKSPVKTEVIAQNMQKGFKNVYAPSLRQEHRNFKLKAAKKDILFLKQNIQEPEIKVEERLEAGEKIFEAKDFRYEREILANKSGEFVKDWEATKDGEYVKEKIVGELDKFQEEKLAFYQVKRSEWETN